MEVFSEYRSAFDGAACAYDEEFTNTPIGRLQRKRVQHFLKRSLQKKPLSVLEINCGTGEDAVWLAQHGHEVVATDASEKMIEVVKGKIEEQKLATKISAKQVLFNDLSMNFPREKFDLIFSDFGGLNCVSESELKRLAEDFSSLLKPDGKLVAVVMGRKCLWERFYFSVKGKFKEAFRRNSKEKLEARIENETIFIWYYSPHEFRKIFKGHFLFRCVKPVGLFVPPSYLNCFFADKKFLLGIFNSLEKIFSLSFLSDYADHYFIELEKKN